jgi:nicotinate dehydrogenase subunit A
MSKTIKFTLNNEAATLKVDDPEMPLLYALRDDYGLHGPRFGCGLGQCGSCTVHIDGKSARSCVVPVSAVAGKKVLTLEGLSPPDKVGPLQQAFIDEQAVQCGYCMNGMIMEAATLLKTNRHPSDAEIREALARNLCRCGTHTRVLRAVKRAAGTLA